MPPDPWFVISDYTIDESTLPAGVEFLVTEVAEERNVYVDGSWQIRTTKVKKDYFNNSGSDPFYIIDTRGTTYGSGFFIGSGVPGNKRPIYKLENDKIYTHQSTGEYFTEGPNKDMLIWEWVIGDKPYSIRGDDRRKYYVLDDKETFYGGGNRQNKVRPKNVKVPSPASFTVFGYQNGEFVDIKGAIHQSLNPNYNPDTAWTNGDPCSGFYQGGNSPLKFLRMWKVIISAIRNVKQERQVKKWIETSPDSRSKYSKVDYPKMPGFKPRGGLFNNASSYAEAKQKFMENDPEGYKEWSENLMKNNTPVILTEEEQAIVDEKIRLRNLEKIENAI